MSAKMHFAHAWEIQYTSHETLCRDPRAFKDLMSLLSISCSYNEDDPYDPDMECSVEDWKAAIDLLNHLDRLPYNDRQNFLEDLANYYPAISTPDDLVRHLVTILDNAYTADGFIHISFF